jgi:hypothetical protein
MSLFILKSVKIAQLKPANYVVNMLKPLTHTVITRNAAIR